MLALVDYSIASILAPANIAYDPSLILPTPLPPPPLKSNIQSLDSSKKLPLTTCQNNVVSTGHPSNNNLVTREGT